MLLKLEVQQLYLEICWKRFYIEGYKGRCEPVQYSHTKSLTTAIIVFLKILIQYSNHEEFLQLIGIDLVHANQRTASQNIVQILHG